MQRDYDSLTRKLKASTPTTEAPRALLMQLFADVIWRELHEAGVSWVGFYLADESAPEDQRLTLGPRRDKPACSPIGLGGVCGAGYRTGEIQLVGDVADLGANYVACDPRDRAELVIPLFEEAHDGARRCWGVLDLDSFDTGAFSQRDVVGLVELLRSVGFQCPGA